MHRRAGDGTIETERLLIRRFAPGDADAFLPLVSSPEVLRFTGERPLASAAEAAKLLAAHQLRDYEVHGYGRMACVEKASGRLIGFCGLKRLEEMGETDIGYRFLPDCWGKGYASESAAAIMAVQPAALGLARVIGLVEPENEASARVLRKIGFAFERRIEDPAHGLLDLYAVGLGTAAVATGP